MADIHDYQEAARATDTSLDMLREYGNRIESGEAGGECAAVALAVLLAGEAITSAIREAATRADYVARDGSLRRG